jgi:hypothetical protein
MKERIQKIKAGCLVWGVLFILLFIPVSCTVLTWKGCIEAEGSFFYCMAVLNR